MNAMAQRREQNGKLEDNPAWMSFVDDVRSRADIQQVMETVAGVQFPARPNKSGDKVICPFHSEKSPSCNVRRLVGHYHCFGCGADGDAFKFVKEYSSVSFVEAVFQIARMFGVTPPDEFAHLENKDLRSIQALPQTDFRVQAEAQPVHEFIVPPAGAVAPSTGWVGLWSPLKGRNIKINASLMHEYRAVDGSLRSIVARCQLPDGKKYFTPITWGDPASEPELEIDAPGWVARGFPQGASRDIYGLEHFPEWVGSERLSGVLFVEGEKKADRAREILAGTGWLILSPQGGQNAIRSMNWDEFVVGLNLLEDVQPYLDRLTVLAWPDADELIVRKDGKVNDRQHTFVHGIFSGLAEVTSNIEFETLAVPVPEGVTSGWDIADAILEGWSQGEILELMAKASPHAGPRETAEVQVTEIDESESAEPDFTGPAIGVVADGLDLGPSQDPAPQHPQGFEVETIRDEDVIIGNDNAQAGNGDGDEGFRPRLNIDLEDHCRPLGYDQEHYYFLPRMKGQIVALSSSGMRPQALLTLAPRETWLGAFGEARQGGGLKIEWERAYDYLITRCHQAGVWTLRNEARVGARMDSGRVFFNSGQQLWVEGVGAMSLSSMLDDNGFASKFVYTVGQDIGAPETENPFTDDSPELQQLFSIIKSIKWRSENSSLYALAFLGWLAIAGICGALSWRPMVWLDGPRGSGKSWIIENIAAKVLGAYTFWVKSNSTESGLRNELNGTTLPILFDEAEGEENADRVRMDQILKLARHASTPGDSMVLQGTSGGGHKRSFAIQTTMLFSSITPQLRHSADKSRFAQLSLAGGLETDEFNQRLEIPCQTLFEAKNFRQRFLGRMLTLANRMEATKDVFVKALTHKSTIERRTADVYGTLLAGAFLFLEGEEDIADWSVADAWLASHGVKSMISEHGQAVSEDKDHDRMMQTLLSHSVQVSAGNGTVRTRVGMLIQIAMGGLGTEDNPISAQAAYRVLNEMGIRVDGGEKPVGGKLHGPGVFFHKDLQTIRDALRETPYASNYEATLRQIDDAQTTGPIYFPGIGTHRTIFIPVEGVLRGFGEHDDDDIGSAKT